MSGETKIAWEMKERTNRMIKKKFSMSSGN